MKQHVVDGMQLVLLTINFVDHMTEMRNEFDITDQRC